MTQKNFDEALRRVLAHEGGYTNHPSDPGGPTNFGITMADYRKYVKADAAAADVRNMKSDEAKSIYRERYWEAVRGDELPSGVDYAVFDYGVNSGIGRAGKVLRRLLRLSSDGSAIDDAVVVAANSADRNKLIAAICDERLAFLQSLKTWPVFGAGWARRVAEVKAVALTMAKSEAPVASSAAKKVVTAGAVVVAGGVAHGTGIASPAAIVFAIAASAFAIAVGWLLWRTIRNHWEREHAG